MQPREADCEAFSKDRLAPMLRDCATLRGKVADARSRDSNNTILHKKFTGGSITMSAASSPAGLAMRSIRYHRRVFAVKGWGGPHPVWSKKLTAKNIRGERPWMVGTDSAKATIMGRLRNAQPGTPGFSHFPADRQQPYFEQLLGKALVTTYSKGQPVREWRPKKGVRHEALDARVYAFGALRALVSMALVLDSEADRIGAQTAHLRDPARIPRVIRSRWISEPLS